MSEFARHPDIAVGDRYPYEIKQIAYHVAAFRTLAADADWERSTRPETMLALETHHFIGSNPYNMSGLFGLGGGADVLRDFYQSTVPSGLATLFRRFIVEFYVTLANGQGKRSARYFCEKGDIDEAAAQGARLFFEAVKDIVIVRDPRDLLCSVIAFWKLTPKKAMIMLGNTIARLARIARHAGPDTIVIRYEDLVREPLRTRRELSWFLDLDLLNRPAAEPAPIPDSHRTSRDPAASIGRWKNDLTPEQVDACEVAFGPYMRDFDYEPGATSSFLPAPRAATENQILAAEGALAVDAFVENSVAESEHGHKPQQVLELVFGQEGTGDASAIDGWSDPEPGFVWSSAAQSLLRLPPIRREGEYLLHITGSPFVHRTQLPAQHVTVLLDGHEAGTARVRDLCVLCIPIPPEMSRSRQSITLTLCFPDAARPSEILGTDDKRNLGFALHRIALFRIETAPDAADPRPSAGASSAPAMDTRQSRASGRKTKSDLRQLATSGMSNWPEVTRVTELSREAFKRPELEYHARTILRDIPGYDSTRFIQLVLALEAEFGISLHEVDVDRILTLGDIVALSRGNAANGE